MTNNYTYVITRKEKLADKIYLMDIKAPRVASTACRDNLLYLR